MKYINLEILERLSRVGDLLRWDRKARTLQPIVRVEDGAGGTINHEETRAWKPLPNIKGFDIKLGALDWLLSLFGYSLRNKAQLEFDSWKNGHANEYVDYMVKRLKTQLKRGQKVSLMKTFWMLMNSNAYQVVAFNYVAKGWYKNMREKEVNKVLRDLKAMCKRKDTQINFKRVYIEKPTGGLRPLGVPTLAWRVYLHMVNNLLTELRLLSEGTAQHGYIPGRGVISAWEALLKKIDSAPNVFEADYKGFFNHVSHELIFNNMVKYLGLPPKLAIFYWDINQSVTTFDEVLMQEPDLAFAPEIRYALQTMAPVKFEGVPQGAATSCSSATIALRHLEKKLDLIIYADDIIYFPKNSMQDPYTDLLDYSQGLLVNNEKSFWTKKDGKWLKDYVQFLGFRYYPAKVTDSLWESLQYPLILFFSLDLVTTGLPLLSVSWVSFAIKFRFEIHSARFMAWTRNGARLEFKGKQAFLAYLNNARTLLLNSSAGAVLNGDKLETFITKKYSSFIQLRNPVKLWRNLFTGQSLSIPHLNLTGWFASRMQQNTWDLYVEQNFALRSIPGSWVQKSWMNYANTHKLERRHLTTFTASTFACHSLLERVSRRQSKIRYVLT